MKYKNTWKKQANLEKIIIYQTELLRIETILRDWGIIPIVSEFYKLSKQLFLFVNLKNRDRL